MFTHWNWIEWENSILFLLWCRNMLQGIYLKLPTSKLTTFSNLYEYQRQKNDNNHWSSQDDDFTESHWALLEQACAGPGEMRATKVTVSLCWCPVETETCSPLLRMRHALRLELSYLTHNCTKQLKYFRDILFKWWSQDVIVFKVKLVIVISLISQWWWWWWCSNFRKINNDSSVEYLSVSQNSRL